MTTKYIWGPNRHTAASLRLYNINNGYLGKYILGDALDLPVKIDKNHLVFSTAGKGCNKVNFQNLDFKKGIPKEIFIIACDESGDIYTFTTES